MNQMAELISNPSFFNSSCTSTAKETSEKLGISKQRVCRLAREGRFGSNAYKKYAKELNYNGAWMIGFPNEYKRKPVGQPPRNNQQKVII